MGKLRTKPCDVVCFMHTVNTKTLDIYDTLSQSYPPFLQKFIFRSEQWRTDNYCSANWPCTVVNTCSIISLVSDIAIFVLKRDVKLQLTSIISQEFIAWQRSWSFTEYWKHFMVCLNDVHAFGYNSARSEQIWMKFGALWVYCLELALTDFGRDPHRSQSGRASRSFFVW